MFYKILVNFPWQTDKAPTSHVQSGKMIQFDESMARAMIQITGETTQTSYTYKFIHLSEAAFFVGLNKFLRMLLQTVLENDPDTVVFLRQRLTDLVMNFTIDGSDLKRARLIIPHYSSPGLFMKSIHFLLMIHKVNSNLLKSLKSP